MVTLSVLAARVQATAAATATVIGSGTSTAEVQALAALLLVLSQRNDLSQNALQLSTVAGANVGPG